jgi:hypothetical protein
MPFELYIMCMHIFHAALFVVLVGQGRACLSLILLLTPGCIHASSHAMTSGGAVLILGMNPLWL